MTNQRCYLWAVWLTWLGLPALALVLGFLGGWSAAVVVLFVGVVAQVFYVRWFPHISRWVGYGSVSDVPADEASIPKEPIQQVTLYTANVCPFCPIVRRRLVDLRQSFGFALDEVDVTFRPQIVRAKGLSSVPVVEANGRFLVGNATSQQLLSFLEEAARTQQPTV